MTEHDEHHHTLSYEDAIEQFRADKDAYFRTGAGSPVPAADRAPSTGLPYFPVDEAYIVDGLALLPYRATSRSGSRSRRPTAGSGPPSARACSGSSWVVATGR